MFDVVYLVPPPTGSDGRFDGPSPSQARRSETNQQYEARCRGQCIQGGYGSRCEQHTKLTRDSARSKLLYVVSCPLPRVCLGGRAGAETSLALCRGSVRASSCTSPPGKAGAAHVRLR
eukprot:8191602-Pyramimonas_sp.AAC.1